MRKQLLRAAGIVAAVTLGGLTASGRLTDLLAQGGEGLHQP